MRRLLALMFALSGVVGLSASCGGDEFAETDKLCDPGENIFCRCRGGEAGTKTCRSSGKSFEDCVTDTGPCTEIPETTATTAETATTADTTTSTGSSTSASSGSGGAPPQYAAYLEPCASDGDCESGICPMGYCTHDCDSYQDCIDGDTYGDCFALILGEDYYQICVPYCNAGQSVCDAYGAPSTCDSGLAVDGAQFNVCADWPPYGTDCADDYACHLGIDGSERVCAFGACTEGCYAKSDCPNGKTCSSSGSLGQCQ